MPSFDLEKKLKEAEDLYEKDEMDRAIDLFHQLAENGNAQAFLYLGLIYKSGDGVISDVEKSRKYYLEYFEIIKNKAAKEDWGSVFELGRLYQYGTIVSVDNGLAIKYIQAAAFAGVAEAQFHLANIYKYGWAEVPINGHKYGFWLEKSVKSEHPEAIFFYAMEIVNLQGVTDEVIALVRKSAMLGFWVASDWLAGRGLGGNHGGDS